MNIFVINSGSSSIKYQLFKMPLQTPVCAGLIERIGLEGSVLIHKVFKDDGVNVINETMTLPNHEAALRAVSNLLINKENGAVLSKDESGNYQIVTKYDVIQALA